MKLVLIADVIYNIDHIVTIENANQSASVIRMVNGDKFYHQDLTKEEILAIIKEDPATLFKINCGINK